MYYIASVMIENCIISIYKKPSHSRNNKIQNRCDHALIYYKAKKKKKLVYNTDPNSHCVGIQISK